MMAGTIERNSPNLHDQDSGLLKGYVNPLTNKPVHFTTPYRAQISGDVTIDLAEVGSINLHLTLVGNVTGFTVLNPADGAVYNFRFIQDATGNRTFAGFASTFDFAGGTAPTFTTTAGGYDFMSTQYGEVEQKFACSFLKGMA